MRDEERKLTEKQKRFCEEFIKDLNGTQALIRAGYSENGAAVEASKLLTNPNIRSYIQEMQSIRSERTLVDAGFVIESLVEVANRCMQAKQCMVWDYEAKAMVPTGEWEFDSQGANKSLELLGKHLGIFEKDNAQKKDAPLLSPQALADMVNKINAASTS